MLCSGGSSCFTPYPLSLQKLIPTDVQRPVALGIHHWASRASWQGQSQGFSITPSPGCRFPGRGTSALPRMAHVLLGVSIPFSRSPSSPTKVSSNLTVPATANVDQKSYPGTKKCIFFPQLFIPSGFTQGQHMPLLCREPEIS